MSIKRQLDVKSEEAIFAHIENVALPFYRRMVALFMHVDSLPFNTLQLPENFHIKGTIHAFLGEIAEACGETDAAHAEKLRAFESYVNPYDRLTALLSLLQTEVQLYLLDELENPEILHMRVLECIEMILDADLEDQDAMIAHFMWEIHDIFEFFTESYLTTEEVAQYMDRSLIEDELANPLMDALAPLPLDKNTPTWLVGFVRCMQAHDCGDVDTYHATLHTLTNALPKSAYPECSHTLEHLHKHW